MMGVMDYKNSKKHLYLFTLEVAPLDNGGIYRVLPSHCTLVSRFWSELLPQEIEAKVAPLLNNQKVIELIFGNKEIFNESKAKVNLIHKTNELYMLHSKLCDLLDGLGVEYTTPLWIRDGWRPHVTERPDVTFAPGMRHLSKAVYFIEVKINAEEDTRYIRAKFDLK